MPVFCWLQPLYLSPETGQSCCLESSDPTWMVFLTTSASTAAPQTPVYYFYTMWKFKIHKSATTLKPPAQNFVQPKKTLTCQGAVKVSCHQDLSSRSCKSCKLQGPDPELKPSQHLELFVLNRLCSLAGRIILLPSGETTAMKQWVRTHRFLVERCDVTTWSIIFASPVSGLNVVSVCIQAVNCGKSLEGRRMLFPLLPTTVEPQSSEQQLCVRWLNANVPPCTAVSSPPYTSITLVSVGISTLCYSP